MRTIKFRAISEFKGEGWVYGDLRHYNRNPHTEKWTIHVSETGLETDVDKGTIGQFTGIYDKNGKEIYEGDIVDAWSAGHHSTCNVIKYVAPKFFISLINKETGEISDFWNLSPNAFGKDELLEVIGNIHDNPELIHS